MAKRNKFSLSHTRLLSCDMGLLVPCGLIEVLPGDTVQHATSLLVRAQALLSPVMHRVDVRVHHWYVPNRLVWDDWEKFITGGPDGMDASVAPTINTTWALKSLGDYFGLPTGNPFAASALPIRAYGLIFNEFYRDQDLVTARVVSTASGADTTTATTLANVGWEKDYFTSSRPWEQKGPQVTLPLTGTGTVTRIGTTGAPTISQASGAGQQNQPFFGQAGDTIVRNASGNWSASEQLKWGTTIGLEVQGSSFSAPNVNQFRAAFAMQRFEEMRARYGSRYTEYLRALGVRSSDGRLQRPEYLGGGSRTIQFSEVLQTGVTTSGSSAGVGTMRGHGINAMRSNRYRRFFEEHGFVISILSIRPKTMYINGLPRMWSRDTKDKYWQPEFEHIGQQKILQKEVFVASATPEATFGYQDRYDEYRRVESGVSGEFRSTLDYWHMARIFATDPALNSTFVQCVPTERTFSVPAEDVMLVMANHSIQARRLVAKTGSSFIF